MSVALRVFERLTETGEDPARAKVIAEGFEQLEEQHPGLQGLATQSRISETELRLHKEIREVEATLRRDIESVRLEIREVEAGLRREIESVRLEIKEVEAGLRKEIETVRLEIKEVEAGLRKDIEQSRRESREMEVRLTQAIHRQTLWVVGSVGAVVGLIRVLEWFLAHSPRY